LPWLLNHNAGFLIWQFISVCCLQFALIRQPQQTELPIH